MMVRLAIAGSGGMAQYHAKKFSSLSNCVLSACKDHVAERARQFAQAHNIPLWFDDIDTLLSSGSSHALSCAVVDWRHFGVCLAALKGNLAVFCEKPMTRTIAEAEQLSDIVQSCKLPNLVNFSKRNAPALHAMRSVIKQGDLGNVKQVSISYMQGWVASGLWGDWRKDSRWKWRLMGDEGTAGVVGDLGSHVIDALLFLFDTLSIESTMSAIDLFQAEKLGMLGSLHPTEEFITNSPSYVQVTANAFINTSIPCSIDISYIDPNSIDDFRIVVEGSEGTAELDLHTSRIGIEVSRRGFHTKEFIVGPEVPSTYECFCNLVDNPSSKATIDVFPDFVHGLRVQKLLDNLVPGGLPT